MGQNIDDYEKTVLDLQNADAAAEIEKFKKDFSATLQELKEAYGDYSIGWGLVQWFS